MVVVPTTEPRRGYARQGELLKFTNVVRGWQRRFFKLENGMLSYYIYDEVKPTENAVKSSKSDPKHVRSPSRGPQDNGQPKNSNSRTPPIPPTNASPGMMSRSVSMPYELRYRGSINLQFCVVTPDDSDPIRFAIDLGTQILHLKAECEQERDGWVNDLNSAKKYVEGIVARAENRTMSRQQMTDIVRTMEKTDLKKTASKTVGYEWQATSGETSSPNALRANSNVVIGQDLEITEDDGLREALKNHQTLVTELRRIQNIFSTADKTNALRDSKNFMTLLQDALAPELLHQPPADKDNAQKHFAETPEGGVLLGLYDLVEWSLNVLKTEDQLWVMQAKAEAEKKRLAEQLALKDLTLALRHDLPKSQHRTSVLALNEILDEEEEDVFFDALAGDEEAELRASSKAVGFANAQANQSRSLQALRRVETLSLAKSSEFRSVIPTPSQELKKVSVWSVLKDAVGKDLSKISVPVVFNEPISFLQRMAEDVEYSELLDQAVIIEDDRERIMLVAAFGLSHYSSTMERLGKPFNPMLAETFELVSAERKLRIMSEQVSHHPPVSCIHAEGHNGSWLYRSNIEVKNKFWGKSLEVFPTGWNHVIFPELNRHYTYHQPTTCVHNIVVGNLWVDTYGDVIVKEHTTGMECAVMLYKSGWMSDKKMYASIKGEVRDKDGKFLDARLVGRWDSRMDVEIGGVTKNIFNVNERPPPEASAGFNMTQWAIGLNTEVPKGMENRYAPTDSRFRPDQRFLEKIMVEEATAEKLRLETKQRARRKKYEEQGRHHEARWFKLKLDPVTGEEDWEFTGEYWNCKEAQKWDGCLDIFGPGEV